MIDRTLDRLWARRRSEEGATATEYIVLLVFIALAIFVGALILGGGLNSLFKASCDELVAQAENSNVTGECAEGVEEEEEA